MRLLAIALLSIQFVAGAAVDYSKIQDEGDNVKLLANAIAVECGGADTEQAHYICVATFIKRVMNQLQSSAEPNIVPFDPPFPFDPPWPGDPRPFPPGPEPDYPINYVALPAPPIPFESEPLREPGSDEIPNDYPDRDRDEER